MALTDTAERLVEIVLPLPVDTGGLEHNRVRTVKHVPERTPVRDVGPLWQDGVQSAKVLPRPRKIVSRDY